MIRYAFPTVLVVIALITAAFARPVRVSIPAEQQRAIDRGRYLVEAMDCNACHTPHVLGTNGPELDTARRLSGHPEKLALPPAPKLAEGPWMVVGAASMTAWAGPWGTSFAANLTPDAETGIGRWTEKEFVDTVRSGRHLGRGREVLPPMPMGAVATLNDEDLHAMFSYLQSLPPVRNQVPAPIAPAQH